VDPDSNWERLSITVALMLLVVWGLVLVTTHLSTGIIKDGAGNVVDTYQRSSDVLHLVLPLLTIALGYWFGAAGKERAEKRAQDAQGEATAAKQKLSVVLGMSNEPDLLDKAKAAYPEAFGDTPNPPS
jgi:hypothetical protein